jgi:hypothetical protein
MPAILPQSANQYKMLQNIMALQSIFKNAIYKFQSVAKPRTAILAKMC